MDGLTVVSPTALAGLPELSFDANVVTSVPAQPAIARGPRTNIWLGGAPMFDDAEVKAMKHPSLLMDGVSLVPLPGIGIGVVVSSTLNLAWPFGKAPLTWVSWR